MGSVGFFGSLLLAVRMAEILDRITVVATKFSLEQTVVQDRRH
jgi:hypothetical protein